MKELEAPLRETQQSIECPTKRMKLSIRIENEPNLIESFGWRDFPLILQPDDIVATTSTKTPPSSTPTTIPCTINAGKRKEHPIICRKDLVNDTATFSWGDFPCVDESGDNDFIMTEASASLSSSSPLSTQHHPNTPLFWELPHVVETGSSGCSTDEDEDATAISEASSVPSSVLSRSSRVDFADTVQVREYALTVGDHPYAPQYALSLDWEHSDTTEVALEDDCDTIMSPKKSRPRRLDAWQRRERLVEVDARGLEKHDSIIEC